jgi:hypothetical protein
MRKTSIPRGLFESMLNRMPPPVYVAAPPKKVEVSKEG